MNMGSSERNTLKKAIDEAVDLVATFDGRLSFEPTTQAGHCIVVFSGAQREIHLQISAVIEAENLVKIHGSTSSPMTAPESGILYHGEIDRSNIRNELSLALAKWYGNVIRSLPELRL